MIELLGDKDILKRENSYILLNEKIIPAVIDSKDYNIIR